jgi:hypothetical protein
MLIAPSGPPRDGNRLPGLSALLATIARHEVDMVVVCEGRQRLPLWLFGLTVRQLPKRRLKRPSKMAAGKGVRQGVHTPLARPLSLNKMPLH